MPFTREEQNGNAVLRMKGEMTVYEAASLRDAFLESLDAFDGVIVDLRAVTEIDVPGLQLIVSAQKTAEKRNKAFSVGALSDVVADAVYRIGLKRHALFAKQK